MGERVSSPEYGVEVCRRCDPVKPEHIGPQVDSECPLCGAPLFGLLGTEVVDA